MNRLIPNLTRRFIFPGAMVLCALLAVVLHATETEVRLAPPGLRPVSRPDLVVPADFSYPNRPIALPDYRDESGMPRPDWSAKYVATRRFASDQSAWIYFRNADLNRLAVHQTSGFESILRIWPSGAMLIIEIFKGHAASREAANPVEIAMMSKMETDPPVEGKGFYAVNWSYARFKPDGSPFITAAKVRECHQCHRIAFYLTGDLVFSRLP